MDHDPVLAVQRWTSNAHLIEAVALLEPGYLDGEVFDATYGRGTFWKRFRPASLTTNDRFVAGADHAFDFRAIPRSDSFFTTVVFDPPYKLKGTPALGEFDDRYGTQTKTTAAQVNGDLVSGAVECFRVAAKFLLVKCQDQVEAGHLHWQTDLVTNAVVTAGGRKVERFDLLGGGRPQPPRSKKCPRCGGSGDDPGPSPGALDRACSFDGCERGRIASKQHHAYARPSTLLIFRKDS